MTQPNTARKLDPETRNYIRILYATTRFTQVQLANRFKISQPAVSSLCRGIVKEKP